MEFIAEVRQTSEYGADIIRRLETRRECFISWSCVSRYHWEHFSFPSHLTCIGRRSMTQISLGVIAEKVALMGGNRAKHENDFRAS